MRSEITDLALRDILHHIDLATEFVANTDLVVFKNDLRTLYAVTRCLEIISEASRRVANDVKIRHPSIGWRQIAAAGNVYRHDYEDVAAQMVWDTVHRALPALRAAVSRELADKLQSPVPPHTHRGTPPPPVDG
ncbi:Protein of unknown function DUF86 [Rhodopseudomonas palustris HaA2]|uniref:DUF86 domain-containing protein n=1 Tax=Rhodopseudomonas palustris (strain HaA2) TaxID=316058 RepID=Q2J374_RHOP2|nr:HepT-like ribonuclease domain-containing protein [Rhodopseudomonas palustris]ABD05086.1 Protein of unknown function DUF86 [Rhodopseudomonas palustris HaA2]